MNTRLILAESVKLIHILLIFFVLLGPFILPKKYLYYYIILVILIFMDWNDLDGQCILTRIEHWLRYNQWYYQGSPIEGGPEFFRQLYIKVIGMNISTLKADRLNNFLFILCLLIAFFRFNS
jgi:hypothetical protein